MAITPAGEPEDWEDSVTRITTPEGTNNRAIGGRFDRRTYILIDGPNAGQTVEYWVQALELDGGGSEDVYDEDSGHTSGDPGGFVLAVRNDSETSLVDTDLDYAPLQVDETGALRVTITGSSMASATYPEDSAAANMDNGIFVLAVRNDSATPSTNADGDYSQFSVDSAGRLMVVDGGASLTVDDGGNSITVDGTVELGAASLAALETVTVNQGTSPWVVSGTVTADTELPAASALADADPNPTTSRIGSNILLWNGSTWDRARSAGSIGVQAVGGGVAADGVAAGHPLLNGARASTAKPTAVSADGDVVTLWADVNGRQQVRNDRPALLGIYMANALAASTVTLAADAATAGRFWLVNTSSTIAVAIRRVAFNSVSGTALITLTTPNFTLERVTFTGTPSGATVTPALRDSTDAAATGSIRTASTGMSLTAGATAMSFQVHSVLTAVGETRPVDQVWTPLEDERIVLRQNQGVVLRQATAGTLADTRSVRVDIIWEEFLL